MSNRLDFKQDTAMARVKALISELTREDFCMDPCQLLLSQLREAQVFARRLSDALREAEKLIQKDVTP